MSSAGRCIMPVVCVLVLVASIGCEEANKNKFDASKMPPAEGKPPEPKLEESSPKTYSELLADVKGLTQAMIGAAKGKNLINANAEMRDIEVPLEGLEKAALASEMSDEDKAKVKSAVSKAFDIRQTMIVAVSSGDESVDYNAFASQLEELLAELESVSSE